MNRPAGNVAGGRLRVRDSGPVREITLTRPDVHNALDEELIAALTQAFEDVAAAPAPPRAVLLGAEGKSFCAGADLHYMKRVSAFTPEENRGDAMNLARMFRAVHDCPVFVLGRVQGSALGGGCGLVAGCDLVVASAEARFGFTEVRVGIAPATISPFVVARIGVAHARALFPTGEIFDAGEAHRIGLVDRVVLPGQLDLEIDRVLELVLGAAPGASRVAKALANRALHTSAEETADLIARLRALPEGREGITAFLEKRRPAWFQSLPAATDDPEPS